VSYGVEPGREVVSGSWDDMEGKDLPESLESKFLSNPNAPVLYIVTNIRVGIINISKHQVVVVAKFRCIHILTPFFLLIVAYYFIYCFLLILLIIVCPREMVPMVLHLTVRISSCGEIERQPRFDFIWLRNHLVAIFRVDFNDPAPFGVVCICFVVQNGVENQPDIVMFCGVS